MLHVFERFGGQLYSQHHKFAFSDDAFSRDLSIFWLRAGWDCQPYGRSDDVYLFRAHFAHCDGQFRFQLRFFGV
jgi:hypothetical protein